MTRGSIDLAHLVAGWRPRPGHTPQHRSGDRVPAGGTRTQAASLRRARRRQVWRHPLRSLASSAALAIALLCTPRRSREESAPCGGR